MSLLGDIGGEVSHNKMQVKEAIGTRAVMEEGNRPLVNGPMGEVRAHVWGADLLETLNGAVSTSKGFQMWWAHVVGLGEHTPPACALRRPAEGDSFLQFSISISEQWFAHYEYGPFGELLPATGPLAQTFNHLFSTKSHDWETGLFYYGHRYYSPTPARWLNRDPLEEQGGVNLYGFNRNDAIGRIDKEGQASIATPSGQAAVLQLEIEELASSLNMSVQQFMARQRACTTLHAAYAFLTCKSCGCFTSQAEALKQSACWSRKVALRWAFISAKCDFVLFGSISRGSALALKGHREELAKAIQNMVECSAKAGATTY